MSAKTEELLNRTFNFGIKNLQFLSKLPENYIYNVPKRQLARSSTSIGANYEEAQAAESKKDFIHKVAICCKESRESLYWLKVLNEIYLNATNQNIFNELIKEAAELKKIFVSIKLSAENKTGKYIDSGIKNSNLKP